MPSLKPTSARWRASCGAVFAPDMAPKVQPPKSSMPLISEVSCATKMMESVQYSGEKSKSSERSSDTE